MTTTASPLNRSITWSANLEIGTHICLKREINLFQVSEKEKNEFQKFNTNHKNVKYLY